MAKNSKEVLRKAFNGPVSKQFLAKAAAADKEREESRPKNKGMKYVLDYEEPSVLYNPAGFINAATKLKSKQKK